MTDSHIIEITLKHEGGYVNDPDDPGAETYKGISRRYNPTWPGWELVDACKRNKLDMDANIELQSLVWKFYYGRYMSPFRRINNQDIKAELFDTAVNMSMVTASEMLQVALNLMNRNEKDYDDLVVDGDIGPNTLMAYSKANKKILLKVLNGLQFMRYVEIVEKTPKMEKFFNGWMQRV
jgi:lysozyme family protein